jgi:hypothetical protein
LTERCISSAGERTSRQNALALHFWWVLKQALGAGWASRDFLMIRTDRSPERSCRKNGTGRC